MCGISGIVSLSERPVEPAEIRAQIETLHYRGPNQAGLFVSPDRRCGLGIRRLSIIDRAGGRQPLGNEDETVHLVYNGETYNHLDLRAALQRLGHRLRSYSDGEVILHGYEAWGPVGILDRLRGMGAFALWDQAQNQLLLGRDRFGIKPLYYAHHQGRLYFASEIKAILSDRSFPRQVNPAALEAMLTVGFVPGRETIFAGVYRLPPAHYLLATAQGTTISPYWQLDPSPPERLRPAAELVEQFLALLREAVDLRLMSEVPLGALLSGGVDSGTVAALIQAGLRRKLTTVSIGFEDDDYDETPLARELAAFVGTDHRPIRFGPLNYDRYPTLMHHLEEPQCWGTALPIDHLYRACRQTGLTVVLTGEGADELLGGYFWHRGDALARPLLPLPATLRRWLADLPLPISHPARRVLRRGAADPAARFQDWLAIDGRAFREQLLTPAVRDRARSGCQVENRLLSDWSDLLVGRETATPFEQLLWLDARTRMANYILTQVDRLSMAHSIEARVPFLDHRLWEFCARLPPQLKLQWRTEKVILRRATEELLPAATRTRAKQGLAAPYARWLQAPRLPDWAEDALSPGSLAQAGLFEPAVVRRLRLAHQAAPTPSVRRPNLGPLLMGVLSTQVWYDRFIDS